MLNCWVRMCLLFTVRINDSLIYVWCDRVSCKMNCILMTPIAVRCDSLCESSAIIAVINRFNAIFVQATKCCARFCIPVLLRSWCVTCAEICVSIFGTLYCSWGWLKQQSVRVLSFLFKNWTKETKLDSWIDRLQRSSKERIGTCCVVPFIRSCWSTIRCLRMCVWESRGIHNCIQNPVRLFHSLNAIYYFALITQHRHFLSSFER